MRTMNFEMFDYHTEDWVGKAIYSGMKRQSNAKCFNCGRIGHLRRACKQGIPRYNVFSGNGKLLYYVKDMAKADIQLTNVG